MRERESEYTYIEIDETAVNPKLLKYIDDAKERYLDKLDAQWNNNQTKEEMEQEMKDFDAGVAKDLHVDDVSVHTELATLYAYVCNKVVEFKNNIRKKYTPLYGGEKRLTPEIKDSIIKKRKPFDGAQSKKSILEESLPEQVKDKAAELYSKNKAKNENQFAERENG